MLKIKHALLALAFLSLNPLTSFASFDIFDEDSEGYYGSGQTRPFRDAIDRTDDLSASDRAFLDSVEQTRVTDRTYARLMVGKTKVVINNLENNSSSFLDTYTLNTQTVNDNVYQLLIAGGHMWQQWAFELEFFFSKELSYFTNPVLLGSSAVLADLGLTPGGTYSTNAWVQLNQYALTANVQYIIPRWFSFYPSRLQVHLDAGAGVAALISDVTGTSNDPTNANITPSPENTSTRNFPAVGMLGLGARYQLAQHILMGVAYRYYNMGKSKYGPVQGVKWQSNQLRETGFFVDLTYQF